MLQRVRIGTHHLSVLQHDEAVEGIHAQGAVLLSAQFDGCADLLVWFSNQLENRQDVGTYGFPISWKTMKSCVYPMA